MANYLRPNTGVIITVAANDKLATWSLGKYDVWQIVGYPNVPYTKDEVFSGTGANTTAAFSEATSVTIQAGPEGLYYETGTQAAVSEQFGLARTQGAPAALNATGTLTSTMILTGIVTSTTAAGVTATLDTGAQMDVAIDLEIDDAFEWSVINTGGNTFTVTAASDHTIVGAGAVATVTSARFLTRRTAVGTWVTYRLS